VRDVRAAVLAGAVVDRDLSDLGAVDEEVVALGRAVDVPLGAMPVAVVAPVVGAAFSEFGHAGRLHVPEELVLAVRILDGVDDPVFGAAVLRSVALERDQGRVDDVAGPGDRGRDLHPVEEAPPVTAAEQARVRVDAPLAARGGSDLERLGAARCLVRLNRRVSVLAPAGRHASDRRRLEALADQELAGRAQRLTAEACGAARSAGSGHGAGATWRAGSTAAAGRVASATTARQRAAGPS